MKGRKARGEVLSIALANDGQHQDTGAKMIHAADETTSNIISKSISIGKGRATYRGLVHVPKHLKHCKNNTERSEEHTSELQSRGHLVCRLLLEKKQLNPHLP